MNRDQLQGDEFIDQIRHAFDQQPIPSRPPDSEVMRGFLAKPMKPVTRADTVWFTGERAAQWMASVSVLIVGGVLAVAFWRSSAGTVQPDSTDTIAQQRNVDESAKPVQPIEDQRVTDGPSVDEREPPSKRETPDEPETKQPPADDPDAIEQSNEPVVKDAVPPVVAQQPAVNAVQQSNLLQALVAMNECVRSRQNQPRRLGEVVRNLCFQRSPAKTSRRRSTRWAFLAESLRSARVWVDPAAG